MFVKVYKFFNQVRQELFKIVWPTKKELSALTFVVVMAIIITSIICLGIDYFIHSIIRLLLNL
ncbi:MAG: preprotein translocase subunit SecE [Rickettsiaceae bacterium]